MNKRKIARAAVELIDIRKGYSNYSCLIIKSACNSFNLSREESKKFIDNYTKTFSPIKNCDAWLCFLSYYDDHEKMCKLRIRMLNAWGSGHPERCDELFEKIKKESIKRVLEFWGSPSDIRKNNKSSYN